MAKAPEGKRPRILLVIKLGKLKKNAG